MHCVCRPTSGLVMETEFDYPTNVCSLLLEVHLFPVWCNCNIRTGLRKPIGTDKWSVVLLDESEYMFGGPEAQR